MITGFNTDIEYEGVTYHVQTEDKGLSSPLILSLVYDRGTILASKRSPYEDLLTQGFDEKVLAERLQKQHKLICAAIRAGRLEDLRRMSMRASETRTEEAREKAQETILVQTQEKQRPVRSEIENDFAPEKPKFPVNGVPKLDIPEPDLLKESFDATEDLSGESIGIDLEKILAEERIEAEKRAEVPIPKPKPKIWETNADERPQEMIIEAFEIIEEVEIIPEEAVKIVEDVSPSQKLLADLSRAQSAFGGLTSDELTVRILGDETFYSGDEKSAVVMVFRGDPGNPEGGAHIIVKILGSAFRPQLYHARTDAGGRATVHLQFPVFEHGRAIILVKAMIGGEEAEYRRLIKAR